MESLLITKETDYALRILRALAKSNRLTTTELSTNEQIPQNFAYKILKKLQKAGFVEIARGTGGGCALTSDLNSITLYQLINAMEQSAFLTACTKPGQHCSWQESHDDQICHAHIQLLKIQKTLDQELKSHTLQTVLFGD
ncbi:MAG: Rrf2 family transcriptional regulator [Clostridiales bacterium]|nr:Rrf2 family transcriptional regulator [Clostridiales bacterium]MCI2161394.1 Rrf2 family transcriptional regulator [Oscillospiraceae bacterium]MCI1960752.1 Rrf2 family transcriptional regulator [Clostridiales bacterium]MCI2021193.1 Rrf2 family transcriptional regulator [Clostridiales bacterium]MCI2025576.1 Rrf2 family transcriptional regulator [Clostridiales bacterium]